MQRARERYNIWHIAVAHKTLPMELTIERKNGIENSFYENIYSKITLETIPKNYKLLLYIE